MVYRVFKPLAQTPTELHGSHGSFVGPLGSACSYVCPARTVRSSFSARVSLLKRKFKDPDCHNPDLDAIQTNSRSFRTSCNNGIASGHNSGCGYFDSPIPCQEDHHIYVALLLRFANNHLDRLAQQHVRTLERPSSHRHDLRDHKPVLT